MSDQDQSDLVLAIRSLKIALDLFSTKQEYNGSKHFDHSVHGIALCLFHLGYLYLTYKVKLSSGGCLGPETTEDLSLCEERAIDFFEQANVQFTKIEHVMGM